MSGVRGAAALAMVFASAAPAAAHVQFIEVSLGDCAPNRLELLAGSDYQLHFVNSASSVRDFASPKFFAAIGVASDDRAKVAGAAVEVEGGASVDVRITARRKGSYAFRCTQPHGGFGASGTAVIE